MSKECKVKFVDSLKVDYKIEVKEFKIKGPDYNRAKEKREVSKIAEKYLEKQ